MDARVGLEAVRLERVPHVRVVLARPGAVDEPQEIVHLLAVHRVAPVVARRDREHVRIAPVAPASVPRVEPGRRERDDPRQEVAAAAVVRAGRVLGARGHVAAPAAVFAVARHGLGGALAHDLQAVVEPGRQLVPLDFGVDDALADDAAHEVGPHDAQRYAVGPLREPQDRRAHRARARGDRTGRAHRPRARTGGAPCRRRRRSPRGRPSRRRAPRGPATPSACRGRGPRTAPRGRRRAARTSAQPARGTARSSGSRSGPMPAKSSISGRRSSAWASRAAARNASRSRDRCTGSGEASSPAKALARRRSHMVSARRSRYGVTFGSAPPFIRAR